MVGFQTIVFCWGHIKRPEHTVHVSLQLLIQMAYANYIGIGDAEKNKDFPS